MSFKYLKLVALAAALLFVGSASAATYTDNFSGAKSNLSWNALNYACLTAGTSTKAAGVIPACSPAFDIKPDGSSSGALRLTPAANNQAGAILSNFDPFPSGQGLQVTFITYTYGGNSGGTAGNGADGIAFFLTDGTVTLPTDPSKIVAGGLGGSLGYSCSNTNGQYEGLANAYLGLGIDEYGNFLNNSDNTNTGIRNTNYSGVTTYGTNSYTNGQDQYQPERIGLRGAGNTTWAWLQGQNKTYYSGTVDITKTKAACSSGQYVSSSSVNSNGQTVLGYTSIPFNYNAIPGGYSVLPNGTNIANEAAQTRDKAIPITYKLQISSGGLLNFAYSYNGGAFNPVLVNNSITSSNGPIPKSFRFGFSAGTGGSNNVHEITCFQASPLQSNSSVGANTVQSGQYNAGASIYLATYTSDNWWGSVTSNSVNVGSDGSLSISSTANWDANCEITGGACPSLGLDSTGAIKKVTAQTSRTLLTWNGTSGVAFLWGNLTNAQKTNLNGTDNAGSTRVSWLRGDRTTEQLNTSAPSGTPGTLRARTQVLGDIIDSSPTFVAAPAANTHPDAFLDRFLGSAAPTPPENGATKANTYSAFVAANSNRQNIVYTGSNDGFLHAFAAGPAGAGNTYTAATNNGSELFGYMPAGLLANSTNTSNLVNLTSPTYLHNYYVDATPLAADLFYGGAWHTWLVGGVGTGGSEIYALDITDPSKFSESTAPTSNVVIGDWLGGASGLTNLGQTVGTPIIARMHNGSWAIIFGNGLGSGKAAGIYIGLVDSTGAVTFTFYSTKVGSGTVANGIAYVTSVDLDGDQIADYLYAGDQRGNLWRLDVTSATASDWDFSKFQTNKITPLYVAKSGESTPLLQPITTAPVVASVAVGGGNRVMVMFGTGQKTPFTGISGDVYTTGSQTFYGIWDWDMSTWDATAISSAQYVSLPTKQAVTRTNLLQQTLASESLGSGTNPQVSGYRYLKVGTVVCWQGTTTCSSGNTQYGWLFDLPAIDTNTKTNFDEQIIYSPAIIGGAVVVNTAIPPTVSATTCNAGTQSGWTMAFDPASGGGIEKSFFPDSTGGTSTVNGSTVGGIKLNGVGTPASISYNGQSYLVSQTINGTPSISPYNPQGGGKARVSWKEIRY